LRTYPHRRAGQRQETVRAIGRNLERWVDDVERKLTAFRSDSGYQYLRYSPTTPPDEFRVEDLAVTLLGTRVTWRNAMSVLERSAELDLSRPMRTAGRSRR
jgi:hypothetical protein